MNSRQNQNILTTRVSPAILLLAAATVFASQSHAANITWDGGGADANWATATNWGTDVAPIAADALFFAGTTRLSNTNNLTAGTAFAGVTFNAGAGAFVLGGNQVALTGGITNSSSNLQTINLSLNLNGAAVAVSRALDVGPAGMAINAAVTNSGTVNSAFTKAGTGTLTLGGTWDNVNAFANVTANQGLVNFANGAAITMGAVNTAQNLLIVNGNNAGTTMTLGTGASFTGRGLIKVGNAGTTMANNAVFNVSGGTLTLATSGTSGQARIGIGEPTGGVGVSIFNMNSGTMNILGVGAADGIFLGVRSHSQANFTGGTSNVARFVIGWSGALAINSTTRDLSIGGSAALTVSNTMNIGSGATATAGIRNTTMNLGDGTAGNGTFSTVAFAGGDAVAGTAWNNVLNFNGALMRLTGAGTGALTNFLGNTDTVNVKVGGAIVETVGVDATFSQNLLAGAPSGGFEKRGAGVLSLTGTASTYTGANVLTGGTLAVATLANGGASSSIGASTNAAANLVFNGGTLRYTGATATTDRNFTINAGQNANFDISTLATELTVGGVSNPSAGGLVKSGNGILTLSGAQAFTGATAVNAGTLRVNGSLNTASAVSIANGAILGGTGTIGSVSTVSGSRIAPGAGLGTLTAGSVTLAAGSFMDLDLGGGNDQLNVTSAGGLTLNGGALALFNTGTATAFSGVGTFPIFDYNTSFGGSLENVSIANPIVGKLYNITNNAGATTIDLSVANATVSQWDGSDGDDLWTTAANWSAGIPSGAGAVARFGTLAAAASTISLDADQTVGNIIFDNIDGYTLDGGLDTLTLDNGIAAAAVNVLVGDHTVAAAITLEGNMSSDIAAASSLTISEEISGLGSLTKTGAGALILEANNDYGDTFINGGTVQLAAAGALGNGPVSIAAGATLNANRTDDFTIPNNISGGGTLVKSQTSILDLTGTNTFGTLVINAGFVRIGSATAISSNTAVTLTGGTFDPNENNITIGSLSGTGGSILDNGASSAITTVTVNQTTTGTFTGTIDDGVGQYVAITKTGAAELILAGTTANSFTGDTAIIGGTLTLAKTGGAAAILGNITIGDAVGPDVLQLGGADQIADTSVLTLTAGGAGNSAFFRINGNNETVKGIQTTVGNAAVIENNSAVAASTATLTVDTAGSNFTYDGIVRNVSVGTSILAITKTGNGTLTLKNTAAIGANAYTGATTITNGQLVLDNLAAFGATPIAINSATPGALTIIQNGRDLTTAAPISGTGEFVKSGPNTLTLTGVGAFTGKTIINAGTLGLGANGVLGSSEIVMNGGIIRASGAARALSNPVTVNGDFILGRLTDLNGAITLNANATITATNPDGLANNNSILGPVGGNFRLTLAEGAGGAVAPFGIGTGALVINAANTNSGGTTVASGRVNVSATGTLSAGPLTVNSGALNLNNAAQNVSKLDGTGGTITLATGHTLSITQPESQGDSTYAGIITGAGGIAKSGSETDLTLSGASTFTGGTVINGGGLFVTGSLSGSVQINAGGYLGGTGSVGAVVSTGGELTPGLSPGTLTLSSLSLDAASSLNFELGMPGVVGSGVNDLLSIGGGLTLDGTLGVATLAGFDIGIYRIANYGGSLTDNILDLDSGFLVTYPGSFIDTATTGQVNLVVVPEPGSAVLLLAGLGAMLGRRRRQD